MHRKPLTMHPVLRHPLRNAAVISAGAPYGRWPVCFFPRSQNVRNCHRVSPRSF